MASTFISYRREDAPGYAGRIYDRFVQSRGRADVFLDVDRIDPGADFEQVIKQRLAQCAVFLAVIGPRWLEKGPGRQLPRIFEDNDFVRVELRTALASGARVIPVLVAGASLPRSVELPMDIADLVRRQAVVLGDSDFHHDVGNLITLVAGVLGKPVPRSLAAEQRVPREEPEPKPHTRGPDRPPPSWINWSGTLWSWVSAAPGRAIRKAVLLLVMGGIGLYIWNELPASERKKLTKVVTDGKDLLGSVVSAETPAPARPGAGLPSSRRLPAPPVAVERSVRGAVLDPAPVSTRDFARWLNLPPRRATLSVEEAAVGGVVGQVVRDPTGPLAALYAKDHPVFSASSMVPSTSTPGSFRPRNGRGNHPARAITWRAADAYCRDQGKRLPSADEWLPPADSAGRRALRSSTTAREWLAQERQVITTAPSTAPTTTAESPQSLPPDVSFRCAR
jgi:hypothetical protein